MTPRKERDLIAMTSALGSAAEISLMMSSIGQSMQWAATSTMETTPGLRRMDWAVSVSVNTIWSSWEPV
jgi:hypothetical protein